MTSNLCNVGVLGALRKRILALIEGRSEDLAEGGCKTWEEYQRLTGILQGLKMAERELLELDNIYDED